MKCRLSENPFLSKRVKKNVPSHQLDHLARGRRNIRLEDVKNFLEGRFDRYKKGTDFANLESEFDITKDKAQRILKRGKEKRLFFTPRRKNPQQYYSESQHFEVIDLINNQNYVLNGTTGTGHFNSPLSYAIEQQKAANFLQTLLFAKDISRQINKIELEPVIDKKKMLEKDYYHMISTKEWPQNKGKVLEEFIDERKIEFIHYRNGKIMISISCSERPFGIETEEDILNLFSFFGQVRDRLEYQISDPRGRLVGQIGNWTLKQCEINKDVPITDKAQVTLPDIQLSTAHRVFRLYVKNLGGQAHYRIEELLQVNQPLQLLESILNPYGAIEKKIDTLTTKVESLIFSENNRSKVSQSVGANSALELGTNDDNTSDSGLKK